MALIVITSDADFVYLEFNLATTNWSDAKVRRSQCRSVCMMPTDSGVEIYWVDGSHIILQYQYVDSIDGVAIPDNITLRDKLRELM